MANKLLIFILVMVFSAVASAQSGLPKEVQADLKQKQIMQALKKKDFNTANQYFGEYDALGVQMPIPLMLTRAQVSYQLKNYIATKKQIEAFLGVADRGSKEYDKALTMYASVSPLVEQEEIKMYRFHDNGTVTDTRTGLQWMRCSLGQRWTGSNCSGEAKKYKHNEAIAAAKRNRDANALGYSDWRVPTVEELLSLVYCSSGRPHFRAAIPITSKETNGCEGEYQTPTISVAVFPDTPEYFFWSASPYAYGSSGAWYVRFGYGYSGNYGRSGYSGHVRLVRSGQ